VLERATVRDLLVTYGRILDELTRRQIVRTRDAPAGQLAERLAEVAFDGSLAPNAEKSWDCLLPDGTTLHVKCRVLGAAKPHLVKYRQLSPFRTWEFDETLIILFSADYGIQRATRLPRDLVRAAGRWSEHVHGHIVHATDVLLEKGTDVTDEVREAMLDL
jgi:hypothetical protein